MVVIHPDFLTNPSQMTLAFNCIAAAFLCLQSIKFYELDT